MNEEEILSLTSKLRQMDFEITILEREDSFAAEIKKFRYMELYKELLKLLAEKAESTPN